MVTLYLKEGKERGRDNTHCACFQVGMEDSE